MRNALVVVRVHLEAELVGFAAFGVALVVFGALAVGNVFGAGDERTDGDAYALGFAVGFEAAGEATGTFDGFGEFGVGRYALAAVEAVAALAGGHDVLTGSGDAKQDEQNGGSHN